MTSSDDKKSLQGNIDDIVSATTVYGDEYGNEMEDAQTKADAFGRFFKPFRKIAVNNFIIHFFYKGFKLGINQLTSLFHFPDATYNRAPIISWMQYKVLPAPEDLPILSQPNGYIMGGKLAESYKNGDLGEILKEYVTHRAVAPKTTE